MADNTNDILLDIRNLSVAYRSGGRLLPAVDDFSLQIRRGEDLRPRRRKRHRQNDHRPGHYALPERGGGDHRR